jgi:hypothetical protein
MAIFKKNELPLLSYIATLNYINPFTANRIELEKKILHSEFISHGKVWNNTSSSDSRINQKKIATITFELLKVIDGRLNQGIYPEDSEFEIYESFIVYYLFEKYRDKFSSTVNAPKPDFSFYRSFAEDVDFFLHLPGHRPLPCNYSAPHLFSMFFQIYRAFHFIFKFLIGSSSAAAQLRADIWESLFTCDIKRYQRSMYLRMQDISTLITGPSGSGKEVVARAISYCAYIPFSAPKLSFLVDYKQQYYPLHLAAMPSNLIESELFGHKKGAFTGAIQNRVGWLEQVSEYGSVFLDEIAEIPHDIQVKLLRILQYRTFQPLGDCLDKTFKGRIIAATNKDLALEISQGLFREDLYYRICSDKIFTPPLKKLINASKDELFNLIVFVAEKIIDSNEANALANEALSWICKNLGLNYDWPGNFRELEQCVRNILIKGNYVPPVIIDNSVNSLENQIYNGNFTAEELIAKYCSIIYEKNGSYIETSKILNLDRRTVKNKINLNNK